MLAAPVSSQRFALLAVTRGQVACEAVTSSLSAAPPPRIDGRSARALRTREAIVDACIALVEEGELRPTAPQVAERASVSVRSVFQHFADLPSLHSAVAARIAERVAVLIHPVHVTLPLEVRIEACVRHRAALLEALTPFRRAANVHGPFSPEIREAVGASVEFLRVEVGRAFEPELAALRSPDERDEVEEALAMALSWSAWDALRTDAGCDVETASAVLRRTVRALLS
jgi:TetR/AcrR family transcriptional regulator, regulator of autoinduction and epiphytic fitness